MTLPRTDFFPSTDLSNFVSILLGWKESSGAVTNLNYKVTQILKYDLNVVTYFFIFNDNGYNHSA